MPQSGQNVVTLRIVIERPVVRVLYSLQAKDESPLDAQWSREGRRCSSIFRSASVQAQNSSAIRCAGKVPNGSSSTFASASWPATLPRFGRAGIDIHDIASDLLDRAAKGGKAVIETTVIGTAKDGTPECGTVRPTGRRVVER